MKKLRMIRIRYPPQCREADRQWYAGFLDCASAPNSEAGNPEALLLKEIDETNAWARSGAQLYFGCFTLLLTVNGLGTGWLFTHNGRMPPFTFLLFFVFIGLNLMATIVTFRIRREMLDCDERIADVIDILTAHVVTEDTNSRPLSPMPREAFKIAFFFAGGTLLLLLIFWTVLVVWGLTAGFSSLVVGST
jgi:hypothetical protein